MKITEALAEIKTIAARTIKKREAIMRYFSRDSRFRDPLEADGGSKEFVKRERQAIKDLEERLVKIRSAIQAINLRTSLAVNGTTRTVSEWLNWRREISNNAKGFLNLMAQQLNGLREAAKRQGTTITEKESTGQTAEILVSVNEQELAREIEEMESTLGTLDGKLSLLNATVSVEV